MNETVSQFHEERSLWTMMMQGNSLRRFSFTMRNRLISYQESTGHLFNLEATPERGHIASIGKN
jgi:hypothetical protein